MEPDNQDRALKFLFSTTQNPFKQLLSVVMYAWIDKLDDTEFQSFDYQKSLSWLLASNLAQDLERRLRGITKGLLETRRISLRDAAHVELQADQKQLYMRSTSSTELSAISY
jgi:hypothetical protein